MASKPYSKTVRGTLDNPKTQEAMKSNKATPNLGDGTSLKPEDGNKPLPSNDSAPPEGQGNDAATTDPEAAPTVSDPYRKNENASPAASQVTPKEELPHSKKVRGTLANSDGKKVNKTQLGDPASLKAETSKTEFDAQTEREGTSGKSKL